MMTTSVDWKSVGLDFGSNTEELDWNDWKRPLISLVRAKLLRNRTSTKHQFKEDDYFVGEFLRDWKWQY